MKDFMIQELREDMSIDSANGMKLTGYYISSSKFNDYYYKDLFIESLDKYGFIVQILQKSEKDIKCINRLIKIAQKHNINIIDCSKSMLVYYHPTDVLIIDKMPDNFSGTRLIQFCPDFSKDFLLEIIFALDRDVLKYLKNFPSPADIILYELKINKDYQ